MIFPFIRYKKQQQPCIAQGPTIKSARYWYGDFEGSKIAVSMPPSNETSEFELTPSLGSRFDYRSNTPKFHSVNRWSSQSFLRRRYRFWGPRGVGEVNSMRANLWFGRPCEPKPGVSLFHPRVFEFEVIDYIDDRFNTRPEGEIPNLTPNIIRVPIDWQAVERLPGPAASFYVDTGRASAINYYFATVLDDYDLLFVGFMLDPNGCGPKHIPAEEWVDLRHMKQLIFDIYDTVEVVLSPQAESRRLKAIEGLEVTSLKTTLETHNFQTNPYKPNVPEDGQPSQNSKMLKPPSKGSNQQRQHGRGQIQATTNAANRPD